MFVEVKTRSNIDFVPPAEAIDERKEDALHGAARDYLDLLDRDDIAYRFDVVEVHLKAGVVPACTLIQNFSS